MSPFVHAFPPIGTVAALFREPCAVNASRNYDPSPQLEKISVPVMFVNPADDFIIPPELGIAEREVKRVKNGKFVLIPTHGHGTHTWAAVWQQYLKELLDASQH